MKQKIELQKTRDFGEVVGDTFTFIFQNIKPLLGCFFAFAGIFLLGNIVVQSLLQTQLQTTIASISSAPNLAAADRITPFSLFNWQYVLLTVVFALCMYTAVAVTVLSFMALYREKGNIAPTLEEVWGYMKYYFFKVMLAQFVMGLLICLGFAMCLAPGFWLFPIFAMVLPVIVLENTSFSYAFNKAFNIIKDNWWVTFGALIVTVIITWFCVGIVAISLSMFNITSTYLYHTQRAGTVSPVFIIISTTLQQLCSVFTIVPLVASGLCYYNLTEVKEGTGILGRIQNFGKNTPDSNFPAEEY